MAGQKYASMAAKDTREAGSLPSDFDATITNVQFTKEAPEGYDPGEGSNPIFGVITVGNPTKPAEGGEIADGYQQSYSLGGKSGDEFTISSDGYGLIPVSDEFQATRKGSKWDLVKCSLENNGVSSTVFENGDMSKLIGYRVHFKRIEDAKLLGKAREFQNENPNKKSKFPPKTLVVTKVLAAPGEAGSAPAATTSSAGTTANTGAAQGGASDVDLDTETGLLLLQVLEGAKGNEVQRSQLTLHLSKAAGAGNPRRQDIARRGADEGFLKSLAETGVITYDPAAKPQVVKKAA